MNRSNPIVISIAAVAMLSSVGRAGDGPKGATMTIEAPGSSDGTPASSSGKRVNWWSIPRPARDAVQKLAASRDASVTRCMAIDNGETISYEFHASRRQGLFKRSDFVLTRANEPKATADKREEERSFKHRWERFRNTLSPPPKADNVVGRTGYLDPSAK